VNSTHTEQIIRAALREVAPEADLERLAPTTDLRDALELDSLDFLRFVELLSERTGHAIDEEDYSRLATLSDAQKFLSQPA